MTGRLRSRWRDGEQPGLRAGAGMGVDRLPVGDDEALGRAASPVRHHRCRCAIAPSIRGGQQLLERREQDVLQVDGQRQQAVEEGRDRRQLVPDAVGVHQLQPGGILERLKRATLDLAA